MTAADAARTDYYAALEAVHRKAERRGLTFVEVMRRAARLAEHLLDRGWPGADGPTDPVGVLAQGEHGMRTTNRTREHDHAAPHVAGLRARVEAARAEQAADPRADGRGVPPPAGVTVGKGPPPPSTLTAARRSNPLTAILVTLEPGAWVRIDTTLYSPRSIGLALAWARRTAPAIELQKRYEVGGPGVVIVRTR